MIGLYSKISLVTRENKTFHFVLKSLFGYISDFVWNLVPDLGTKELNGPLPAISSKVSYVIITRTRKTSCVIVEETRFNKERGKACRKISMRM